MTTTCALDELVDPEPDEPLDDAPAEPAPEEPPVAEPPVPLSPPPPSWEIAEVGFFPLNKLPEGTTEGTRRRLEEILYGAPVSAAW